MSCGVEQQSGQMSGYVFSILTLYRCSIVGTNDFSCAREDRVALGDRFAASLVEFLFPADAGEIKNKFVTPS